jgi:hypothetical protein
MKSIYRQATTVNCLIRWAVNPHISGQCFVPSLKVSRCTTPVSGNFKTHAKTKTSRRSDWSKLAVLGGEIGSNPLARVKNFKSWKRID